MRINGAFLRPKSSKGIAGCQITTPDHLAAIHLRYFPLPCSLLGDLVYRNWVPFRPVRLLGAQILPVRSSERKES